MIESKLNRSLVNMQEISNVQQMFSLISEKSLNIISSISADGVFTYISPNVKALLGYTPEEVIGKPAASFRDSDTHQKFLEHRKSLKIEQDTVRFTGRVRLKNGDYRWYETTAQYIRNHSGEIIQTIGVGRDITDRIKAEETIAYLANHDSETGLPNRRLFKKRLNLLLEESSNHVHGIMLLDLNGFKYVNDTFGHDVGDQLLKEASKRLALAVGEKSLVARWGGDEFTILQTNIISKTHFTSLVKRIKEIISEPFMIEGNTIFITASIGVAFTQEDGETVDELIKMADAQMYLDKKLGKA